MQSSSGPLSSGSLMSSSSFKDPFAQISQDPWQPLDLSENGTEDCARPEILPESSRLSLDNQDNTYIGSADPNASEFLLSCLIFQEQISLQKTLSSVLHDDAIVTVQIDSSQQGNANAVSCEGAAAAAKATVGTCTAADVDAQIAQLLQPVGSTDPNAAGFLLSCLAFEQQTSLKKTLSSVLHDDAVVTVQVNASQQTDATAVSCKDPATAAATQVPPGDCAADADVETEIARLLQPVGSADPNASNFLLSCLAFEQQGSLEKTLSSVLHDDAIVTVQIGAGLQSTAVGSASCSVAHAGKARPSAHASDGIAQDQMAF